MGLNFNLLDQLTFYGSYHNNRWNQLIHFFFVPGILWSIFVWLSYTGPLLPSLVAPTWVPAVVSSNAVFNAAFLVALVYTLFYLILDFFAGLTWSTFVGAPLWISATAFHQVPQAWLYALVFQAFCWYMQVHPGHYILEGRKPALLDSLAQAFGLAPLFVWYELLFLLGYRPKLRQQLQARVDAELAALRAQTLRESLLQKPDDDATVAAQGAATDKADD